jgi:DNA-binding CsgD family transcriptional regulator
MLFESYSGIYRNDGKNLFTLSIYFSLDFVGTLGFWVKFAFFLKLILKEALSLVFRPRKLFKKVVVNRCTFFKRRDYLSYYGVMNKGSGVMGKGISGFSAERAGVRGSRSGPDGTTFAGTRQPDMDNLLEKALFGIVQAEPLSGRESEILRMIVAGDTNKKIAQKLYRTERTVEYHRCRLMRKLGAKTAAELVKRAIAMGFV